VKGPGAWSDRSGLTGFQRPDGVVQDRKEAEDGRRLCGVAAAGQSGGRGLFEADTVTMFNDMCLMAPATLIDKRITWQTIDDLTVAGTFMNQGVTISAVLHFNDEGQLVNFVSNDRWGCVRHEAIPVLNAVITILQSQRSQPAHLRRDDLALPGWRCRLWQTANP